MSINISFDHKARNIDGCLVWMAGLALALAAPQALVILFVAWLLGLLRFE